MCVKKFTATSFKGKAAADAVNKICRTFLESLGKIEFKIYVVNLTEKKLKSFSFDAREIIDVGFIKL